MANVVQLERYVCGEVRIDTAGRSIRLRLPLRLSSGDNQRGHWSETAAKVKHQREVTGAYLSHVHPTHKPQVYIPKRRAKDAPKVYYVTVTRIAPRELDTDGLWSSGKHVRDEVAKWLGVSDGPNGPVSWKVAQRSEGRVYGTEVLIAW